MKATKPLLALALVLLFSTAGLFYFFGGPFRFVEVPLREASLQHLQSMPGISSPTDAADEYLHGWLHPSDRPKRGRLEISAYYPNEYQVVVTIINRYCEDDSLSVTCNRLTLQQQRRTWIPIKHQAAWQGRGHIGWTTQPPS